MKLEYISTNRIPVSSQEEVSKYLKLCGNYFALNATPIRTSPITSDVRRALVDGCNQISNTLDGKAPLEDLDAVHYASLGFASQIIYDKPKNSFRLRLFADKKLKERGLASTFEPVRYWLTSGPWELGLRVIREVEDNVPVPKQGFSFNSLEKHQPVALKNELKHYLKEANRKITQPKCYDKWLWNDWEDNQLTDNEIEEVEEYNFEKEEAEKYRNASKFIQAAVDYLGENSFADRLKKHSKLFVDMRKDFAKRFPEWDEVIENTALGVLPWNHRKDMVGNFGTLLDDKQYIPSFKQGGFEDRRANFMEAEILVPPKTSYCMRIITMFPYTHAYVREFNQLQEDFCDNPEVIQAMFGHELGEIVLEGENEPILFSPLKMLVDPSERARIFSEERRQEGLRHKKLDKLLVEVGFGEQTKKMYQLYRDKAESLIPVYRGDHDVSSTLEGTIKELDKKIARIGLQSKNSLDFWTRPNS
jgi:hypothetical protein